MSAREEILARVRGALAGAGPAPPVPRDYRRAGTAEVAALVAQLSDRLADYRAGVHFAGGLPDGLSGPASAAGGAGPLPSVVARVLAGTPTLVAPADLPEDWLSEYAGAVRRDHPPIPVAELDAPGVSVLTGCAVAVAETGTIVLDAAGAQGRRALTLVPDHHVCVVRADQIVATVPEGLARLPDPARPLTFISGPSATSDIELDRVEGVHGPRRLDVIITAASA